MQEQKISKSQTKIVDELTVSDDFNTGLTGVPVFQPPKQNPEMIEAERRYKAILEESEREKQRNRSTGLAGLLGLE